MTVLAIGWLLAMLGAIAVLVRGLRGDRQGDTPWCAACGHNLTGLSLIRRACCPECGAHLHRSPGVRRGGRRLRRGDLIVGVLLTIGLLSPLAWLRPPAPPLPPPAIAVVPAPAAVPARRRAAAPPAIPERRSWRRLDDPTDRADQRQPDPPARLADLFDRGARNRYVSTWFAPEHVIDDVNRTKTPLRLRPR